MSSVRRFFGSNKWNPPADPKTSFSGKNVIVTGANTGLGFEAAVKFVALDASRVILGVRDLTKGERAKEAIEKRTGRKGVVEVWKLDMNSYDSVQEFAQQASSSLDHLDVAVLNAGVYMVSYEESPYGWEETLQVNVLSTALLGLLLLPVLKKTAERAHDNGRPVLEIVSSGNHEHAVIPKDHRAAENLLQSYSSPKGYSAGQQYDISKVFVMYVMQTLASFAKSADDPKPRVVVTSVCPGACKSDLARGYTGLGMKIAIAIFSAAFMRTTEEGSRTYVSGTTLGDEAHGRFWQNDELRPPAPVVTGKEGDELRGRVWSEVVDALVKDVANIETLVGELRTGAI